MVYHGHGLINDRRVESLDEEVPLEDSEGVFAPTGNITGKLSNKSLPNLRSSQHWQLPLAMVVCNA